MQKLYMHATHFIQIKLQANIGDQTIKFLLNNEIVSCQMLNQVQFPKFLEFEFTEFINFTEFKFSDLKIFGFMFETLLVITLEK